MYVCIYVSMYRTKIYCRQGASVCQALIQEAQRVGLEVELGISPSSCSVVSPPTQVEMKRHNQFLQWLKQDPDIVLYYDSRHPLCLRRPLRMGGIRSPPGGQGRTQSPPFPQEPMSSPGDRMGGHSPPMRETGLVPPTTYVSGVPADITPTTMKPYYQVPVYDPETTPRPPIAVISLGGYYQMSDLTHYWEITCQMPIGGIRPTVTDHVVGTHTLPVFAQDLESLENTLDIELIGGFCPNASIHFYSAPNTYQGYKSAFEQALLDGMKIISTSWGQSEETFFGGGGLDGFEDVFIQAVTVYNACIVASCGDFGSSDNNYDTQTVSPYPIPVPVPHCDFPASSPHVIACGGTSLYRDVFDEEVTWMFTGGGASSHFPRPAYQGPWLPSWAVSPLAFGGPTTPNARTIPDVSFNADPNSPWHIYFAGYDDETGGTSASAPVMAGILGVFYASSAPDAAPRNGYFGQGFNYFLYRSPTTSIKTINHGHNITVDRQPLTNAINPYGLFQGPTDTYYAVFDPAYSFCAGKGVINGTSLLSYLNTIVCVVGGTQILMEDGSTRPIQTLARGDRVVGHNGHKYPVAVVNRRVVAPSEPFDLVEIPPNSLDHGHPCQSLFITPNHPVFYDRARRPAECLVGHHGITLHPKVQPVDYLPAEIEMGEPVYYLYDLQFEDDGSYVANGVTVQSRSPYSNLTPLPKDQYFDPSKYTEERHWDSLYQTLPLKMENI